MLKFAKSSYLGVKYLLLFISYKKLWHVMELRKIYLFGLDGNRRPFQVRFAVRFGETVVSGDSVPQACRPMTNDNLKVHD